MAEYDLSLVRRFPNTCDAAITRDGEEVPCEKPAVAVRLFGEDEWDDRPIHPAPVCVAHARVGCMVPLADIFWWTETRP